MVKVSKYVINFFIRRNVPPNKRKCLPNEYILRENFGNPVSTNDLYKNSILSLANRPWTIMNKWAMFKSARSILLNALPPRCAIGLNHFSQCSMQTEFGALVNHNTF